MWKREGEQSTETIWQSIKLIFGRYSDTWTENYALIVETNPQKLFQITVLPIAILERQRQWNIA